MTDEQLAAWAIKNQRDHETLLREGMVCYTGADLAQHVEPQWSSAGAESDYRRGFSHGMVYAVELMDTLYRKGFIRSTEIANIIGRFTDEKIYPWRMAAFEHVVAGKEIFGHPFLKQESWQDIRKRILQRDGYLCQECGSGPGIGNPLQVDHIDSVACGGLPDDENLQVLCKRCNLNKGVS